MTAENRWTTVCAMPVAMEFHNAVEYKKIYVLQGRCPVVKVIYWSSLFFKGLVKKIKFSIQKEQVLSSPKMIM